MRTMESSWGVPFLFLPWLSHFLRLEVVLFSGISYHTMYSAPGKSHKAGCLKLTLYCTLIFYISITV